MDTHVPADPTIGHNSRTELDATTKALIEQAVKDALDPELIAAQLTEDEKDALKRLRDLNDAFDRWEKSLGFALDASGNPTKVRNPIRTEGDAKKTTTFTGQLKALSSAADKRRKVEKGRYDAAGKAAHAFFNSQLIGPADEKVAILEGALTEYTRHKIAEERLKAQRLADEQAAAARTVEAAAQKAGSAELMEQAGVLADRAEQSQSRADGANANLGRVTGTFGGTSSAVTVWDFKILDEGMFLGAVLRGDLPREFLTINEGAIRTAIRRKANPLRDQEKHGLRIFDDVRASVR